VFEKPRKSSNSIYPNLPESLFDQKLREQKKKISARYSQDKTQAVSKSSLISQNPRFKAVHKSLQPEAQITAKIDTQIPMRGSLSKQKETKTEVKSKMTKPASAKTKEKPKNTSSKK
jgi:hypothetical protein